MLSSGEGVAGGRMNDGINEVSRRRGYRRPGREGGHGLNKTPLGRCRPLSPARMEVLTQAGRRMLGSGVSPIKQTGTEAWDGRERGVPRLRVNPPAS